MMSCVLMFPFFIFYRFRMFPICLLCFVFYVSDVRSFIFSDLFWFVWLFRFFGILCVCVSMLFGCFTFFIFCYFRGFDVCFWLYPLFSIWSMFQLFMICFRFVVYFSDVSGLFDYFVICLSLFDVFDCFVSMCVDFFDRFFDCSELFHVSDVCSFCVCIRCSLWVFRCFVFYIVIAMFGVVVFVITSMFLIFVFSLCFDMFWFLLFLMFLCF